MSKIIPDQVSWTTQQLHMGLTQTDRVLASGTGFTYENDGQLFLVTNWHNVAGRDPETGRCLSESLAVPDLILTYFRDPSNLGNGKLARLPLYHDSEMQEPAWYEHPELGRKVDVAILPIATSLRDAHRFFPINAIQFDVEYKAEVADDAFVIGYPFSDMTDAHMPIWKRASIASEPDIDQDRLPKLLIDTATRSGLSGSPVIGQRVGVHGMVGGQVSGTTSFGRIRSFIGVYSGRIGNDELKAQLGIVWKAPVIDEIIAGRRFARLNEHTGIAAPDV
jgi:hypothetical protein